MRIQDRLDKLAELGVTLLTKNLNSTKVSGCSYAHNFEDRGVELVGTQLGENEWEFGGFQHDVRRSNKKGHSNKRGYEIGIPFYSGIRKHFLSLLKKELGGKHSIIEEFESMRDGDDLFIQQHTILDNERGIRYDFLMPSIRYLQDN